MKITKEMFLRYEKVRLSGKYNMIMDSETARIEACLSKEEYLEIIKQYSVYKKMFIED